MSVTLTVSSLRAAVARHAAIRRISRLQPAGGASDNIFPPTYPAARRGEAPRDVFERRRVDGREAWCVLIDSVQSQANRLEEALLAAAERDGLPLPYVTVDFRNAGLDPRERITSLDAPHRVYGAILRDSLQDDEPFMQSKAGRRLAEALQGTRQRCWRSRRRRCCSEHGTAKERAEGSARSSRGRWSRKSGESTRP